MTCLLLVFALFALFPVLTVIEVALLPTRRVRR